MKYGCQRAGVRWVTLLVGRFVVGVADTKRAFAGTDLRCAIGQREWRAARYFPKNIQHLIDDLDWIAAASMKLYSAVIDQVMEFVASCSGVALNPTVTRHWGSGQYGLSIAPITGQVITDHEQCSLQLT
ncbi:hypothetical protein D3C76_1572230 [compost metagenome]